MSDTSLVFNLIGRERVTAVLGRVSAAFRATGDAADQGASEAARNVAQLDTQIDKVERSLAELNAEFARTGDKELFAKMSRDRSLLSNLRKIRTELDETRRAVDGVGNAGDRAGTSLMSRLGGSAVSAVQSAMANVGTGVTNVTTNLWNLIPVLAGAAAGMQFMVPAAYLAGGAIGSLPAIIAGAAAAVATLKLGFGGLSQEYQRLTTASGGGGGAARDMTAAYRAVEAATKDVTRAEREHTRAVKDAKEAQEAVNAARATAVERLQDMDRDLRGTRLDEADAVAGVTEAERELAEARKTGSVEEIDKASRAYERSELTLENVRDRLQDLTAEQDKATKAGVEGSDEVVQAKERERDALQRVADAQDRQVEAAQRLADAQKALNAPAAGGGGGGAAVTRLAPAARAFLNTLIGLRPAFDNLRLDVQQRLFAGLSSRLQVLADRWIPQLHTSLGGMAEMFNGVFKTLFDSLSKPTFISDVAKGIDAMRYSIGRVGQAVAGPLVGAFGQLAAASDPFVRMLGDKLAAGIEKFSTWIDTLSTNGGLDEFFGRATSALGDVFDMFEDILSIGGSVMEIIFGSALQKSSMTPWEALKTALDKLATWFKDPENQKKIKEFMDKLYAFGKTLVTEVIPKVESFFDKMDQWAGKLTNPRQALADFLTSLGRDVRTGVDDAVGTVTGFPGRVGQALADLAPQAGRAIGRMHDRMGYLIGRAIGTAVRTFVTLPGRLARALQNAPAVIGRQMDRISQAISRAVDGLPGRLWRAGQDVVRGLWEGISSMGGWLYSRAHSFVDMVKQGFKDGLGIASPSTVMAEVGRWIPAGVAVGMDAGAGDITNATRRMADLVSDESLSAGGDALGRRGGQQLAGQPLPAGTGIARVEVYPAPGAEAGLIRELLKALRYAARTDAGGNVQKLLGVGA